MLILLYFIIAFLVHIAYTLWFKKNAPTLADYNYDPVQSILIIFSKLFVNDHKRHTRQSYGLDRYVNCRKRVAMTDDCMRL